MMVQLDQYIYMNCWSFDNQVLVIDSEPDRVMDSIEVFKQPNSMVLDEHAQPVGADAMGDFPKVPMGMKNLDC